MIKNINVYRRKITKLFTRNFEKPLFSFSQLNRIDDVSKIKKILIIRPNHRLGNILLITPLVQEVQEIFPNATISFFVKGGVTPIIFQNYQNMDGYLILPKKHFKEFSNYIKSWFTLITKKYDLVINIDSGSSSGNLATKFSKSKYKFFGNEFDNLIEFSENQRHFAKFPVYKLRNYIYSSNHDINEKPVKELNLKLNETELKHGKSQLNNIISDSSKETIAIFTFATGSKCYDETWWNAMYSKLLASFPNYNIIEVLPVENVSQINFKAPTFYSKDIREIAALIANTKLFVGADSGMMHLACTTETAVIGLFSVTKSIKYGPYGKNKFAINTNKNSIDQCIEMIEKTLEK